MVEVFIVKSFVSTGNCCEVYVYENFCRLFAKMLVEALFPVSLCYFFQKM